MSVMQETQEEVRETIEDGLPISPGKAGIIVFLSIFAFMVLGLGVRVLAEVVWGKIEWNSPFMLVEVMIVVPAIYIVRHYRYSISKAFRLNPVAPSVLLWSVFAGISLAVLGDQLDRIIQLWFPMPLELIEQLELTFMTPHLGDFILLLVIATIGAGICEEMLFRGFLQQIFEKRLLLWSAILLPALLFGVIHVLPWLVVQISILGIALGLIAWRTKSIYPTIIMHALNNLVAILFIRFATDDFKAYYQAEELVNPTIVMAAIGIFILSVSRIWRSGVQEGI